MSEEPRNSSGDLTRSMPLTEVDGSEVDGSEVDESEVDHVERTGGKKTRSRLRSSLPPATSYAIAVLLTALTHWVAIATRYHGLVYYPSMFASNPQNAIVTIQFLASITLIAVRECYVMSSESLRWSLAANGTKYLSFLVLSQSTGFMGLLRIIISRRGNLFSSWRLLAMFRFLVLYVALVVAQFIWVLNIDSRTAYMPLGSDQQRFQSKRLGIGDFNLTLGTPWPFSQVDSWEYLMDRSRVVTIA